MDFEKHPYQSLSNLIPGFTSYFLYNDSMFAGIILTKIDLSWNSSISTSDI